VTPPELPDGWVRHDTEHAHGATRRPQVGQMQLTVYVEGGWAVVKTYSRRALGATVTIPTAVLRALLASVPE